MLTCSRCGGSMGSKLGFVDKPPYGGVYGGVSQSGGHHPAEVKWPRGLAWRSTPSIHCSRPLTPKGGESIEDQYHHHRPSCLLSLSLYHHTHITLTMARYRPPPPPPVEVRLGGIARYDMMPPRGPYGLRRWFWKKGCVTEIELRHGRSLLARELSTTPATTKLA
jgi:hypothetical protein